MQVPKKGSVDPVIANAKIGSRKIKVQFPGKLIIAHLNINSTTNKFESLSFMVENNVDMLLISETKLDDSFPSGQFKICGYGMPYQNDANSMSIGLLVYIRDDIRDDNFWKMILEIILKIYRLKLIYEKESDFSMALTISIKAKFWIS